MIHSIIKRKDMTTLDLFWHVCSNKDTRYSPQTQSKLTEVISSYFHIDHTTSLDLYLSMPYNIPL